MRGDFDDQLPLFHVFEVEDRIPTHRPKDKQQQKKPSTKKPPNKELPRDSNGFKPTNPDVDFHGQQRTNATHASQTDLKARLYRKGRGKEAKRSHLGHALNENRHGLLAHTIDMVEHEKTRRHFSLRALLLGVTVYAVWRLPSAPGLTARSSVE